MDLLIHAIVWLFKNLFGEQEPQARLGSGEREERERTARGERGPYRYGDERKERTGPQPKTLAELLEEARQQMEGAPTARPTAPPSRRTVLAPPEPEPEPEPIRRAVIATLALPALPTHFAPVAPPPLPAQAQAARQFQKPAKKQKRRQTPPSTRPQAEPIRQSGVPLSPSTSAVLHGAAPPKDLEVWLEALRSPRQDLKRSAGMRAIASLEIMGPPRCRRPFRGS